MRVRVVVIAVHFEEHLLLDQVLVLLIRHRGDALLDQLLQGLDIETEGDEFLFLAHLEKGAHFHLSVLILYVSLTEYLCDKYRC